MALVARAGHVEEGGHPRAMSRLQVNCGPGKKETVQVQPNTTLGFVLEEVCKRRKLSPEGYSLKHQRNVLDGALTVRFAGLSPNATIDLVAEAAAARLRETA